VTAPIAGVDGFISGLHECGIEASVRDGVVTFVVAAVDGAFAGRPVEVGVSVDELGAWPAIPPHWVHLPPDVRFARSNTQASEVPGWVKHSRGTNAWGDAAHPPQAYVAHLRAVVGEAA
jgi:hypothetical protein